MAFCSQCGGQLVEGAAFCTACGTSVEVPKAVEPGTPETASPAQMAEPPSEATPPIPPPATAEASSRNTRPLLYGGIAAVALAVIAGAAWFATQQGTDDPTGVVMPVAQGASEDVASTTSASATTAAPATTTSAATSTATPPPTTTTTLPADLVAAIEGTGVFLAPGSSADQESLDISVANARNHDWALSVIAVPTEPEGGSSPYAATIATTMNLGTVVVVSPDGLGWASQESQFFDGEFERAWSLVPPGATEAAAVRSFVWSVLGGPDSVGAMDSRTASWYLLGANGIGNEFTYGDVGDTPLMGDWDCDGVETVGIWRPSGPSVFLRNSNAAGDAAVDYDYPYTGAVAIAGDFDGDGCSTISFHIPGEARLFIFNTREDVVENATPDDETIPADHNYAFGDAGDVAFVGDFDGDGIDTIGLFRPSTGMFYLKNSHEEGPADIEFAFGEDGDIPLAGDWTDQDGIDSIAVYRPSTGALFFRYANSSGPPDETLEFGAVDVLPVAGAFGLDRSG